MYCDPRNGYSKTPWVLSWVSLTVDRVTGQDEGMEEVGRNGKVVQQVIRPQRRRRSVVCGEDDCSGSGKLRELGFEFSSKVLHNQ